MTTNTNSQTSLIQKLLALAISIISLAKMIYDLFHSSPIYIFIIALTTFTLSGGYYLVVLYKDGKHKALWRIFLLFYILSMSFAIGGSWYYFTQYDAAGTPIESYDTQVIPYEGGAEGSWADLSFYTTPDIHHTILSYQVDFGVPMEDQGWAGFYIDFKQPIDLSKYKSISFQIQYGCDEDRIKLILKDNAWNEFGVLLDQSYLKGKYTDKQLVAIPLETFADVTLDHIKNITFHADSSYVRGEHWVLISDLHFVK